MSFSLLLSRRSSLIFLSFVILGSFLFEKVDAVECLTCLTGDYYFEFKMYGCPVKKGCQDQCGSAYCINESNNLLLVHGCRDYLLYACDMENTTIPKLQELNEDCLWDPEIPFVGYTCDGSECSSKLAGCIKFLDEANKKNPNGTYQSALMKAPQAQKNISYSNLDYVTPYISPDIGVLCHHVASNESLSTSSFFDVPLEPNKNLRCPYRCFAAVYEVDGKAYWYEGCLDGFFEKYPAAKTLASKVVNVKEGCFWDAELSFHLYACSEGDCSGKLFGCTAFLKSKIGEINYTNGFLTKFPDFGLLPDNYTVPYLPTDVACRKVGPIEIPVFNLTALPRRDSKYVECQGKCHAAVYEENGKIYWYEGCVDDIEAKFSGLKNEIIIKNNCAKHTKYPIVFATCDEKDCRDMFISCMREFKSEATGDDWGNALLNKYGNSLVLPTTTTTTSSPHVIKPKPQPKSNSSTEFAEDHFTVDKSKNMASLNVFDFTKAFIMMTLLIWSMG